VIAQQVIDKGLETVSFVGEPPNMSKFSQALKDQGFDGVINADANQYDQRLIEASGPAAVEGAIVRIATHPFEEADKWPAIEQLVSTLDDTVPDWTHAGLAIQSFSATLLFAQAAKSCGDAGEITRACVLEAGQAVHEWDGGGLHAVADPGANTPADCAMLVQIKGGKFERLFPELGSDDDNGDGFFCSPTVKLTGDFGKGNTDSSILG
jgi:ABC-type branched-subunit amino acid transport system substrate-binding protein